MITQVFRNTLVAYSSLIHLYIASSPKGPVKNVLMKRQLRPNAFLKTPHFVIYHILYAFFVMGASVTHTLILLSLIVSKGFSEKLLAQRFT